MCFVISWPFSICVCFVIYLEVEAIYVTLAIVAIAYFDSSLHSSQIETLNAVLWNWPPVFMTLYLHPFQQLQHFPFNTVVTTSESFSMFVDGTCVTLSIGGCCCASFLGQRRTTYLGIALGFLSLLLYLCFNLCQLDALNVFFWVSQIMPFFGHFCKGSDKCRMARCALNFIYSYCKDLRFQCDIVFFFICAPSPSPSQMVGAPFFRGLLPHPLFSQVHCSLAN